MSENISQQSHRGPGAKVYAAMALLAALVVCGASACKAMPIVALPVGAILIGPLTSAVLTQFDHAASKIAILVALCACNLLLCPDTGIAVLSIGLWYLAAGILNAINYYTGDMFIMLAGGGAAYLLGMAVCVAVHIKCVTGVWDIMSIFTTIENGLLYMLDMLEPIYTKLPGDYATLYADFFALMRQSSEGLTYQILSLIITTLCGVYLITMRLAKCFSWVLPARSVVPPIILYRVPGDITLGYIIVSVIGLFVTDPTYLYAWDIADTLMGWMFVFAAIAFLDSLVQIRLSYTARRVLKIAFVIGAYISDNFSTGIFFLILSILGLITCLPFRIIFRRRGGDK